LELPVLPGRIICLLEFIQCGHQRFGHKTPAVSSEISLLVR
jgi:hypothetical protein